MGKNMLKLSALTLGYGGKPVLQLNGMQLARGEHCLITGASGSGKTTLLYAIAGLIAPIHGSIEIDGTDISQLSESGRDRFRGRHIGVIFQTLHLIKSLTVMNNLLLASYLAGSPQNRTLAVEVLEQLGIGDKKHDLPDRLSQGQQQRVAIARAIMASPALILADEPTSSLDDAAAESVIMLLQQVAKAHDSALVISTHDSRVKGHFGNALALGGPQ